jgi:hypothetical protein
MLMSAVNVGVALCHHTWAIRTHALVHFTHNEKSGTLTFFKQILTNGEVIKQFCTYDDDSASQNMLMQCLPRQATTYAMH